MSSHNFIFVLAYTTLYRSYRFSPLRHFFINLGNLKIRKILAST
jgi:hypothetical protein